MSCVITVHVHWLGKESWMKQWKNYKKQKVKAWWGEREALCGRSSYLLSVDTNQKKRGFENLKTGQQQDLLWSLFGEVLLYNSFPEPCSMYHFLALLQPPDWYSITLCIFLKQECECNLICMRCVLTPDFVSMSMYLNTCYKNSKYLMVWISIS